MTNRGFWADVRLLIAGHLVFGPLVWWAITLIPIQSEADARTGIQSFLVRGNYLSKPGGIRKANNYRLTTYTGIRSCSFMGLPAMLHETACKSLKCVENSIRGTCSTDYQPKALSSWRPANTYRGDEISNHVFGLALDIDPMMNPCCGCKGHWAESERCPKDHQGTGEAPIGDYVIPNCWIDRFAAHGWYWLGNDPQLRDTMHFEYLAPPNEADCGG